MLKMISQAICSLKNLLLSHKLRQPKEILSEFNQIPLLQWLFKLKLDKKVSEGRHLFPELQKCKVWAQYNIQNRNGHQTHPILLLAHLKEIMIKIITWSQIKNLVILSRNKQNQFSMSREVFQESKLLNIVKMSPRQNLINSHLFFKKIGANFNLA